MWDALFFKQYSIVRVVKLRPRPVDLKYYNEIFHFQGDEAEAFFIIEKGTCEVKILDTVRLNTI